MHFKMDAKSCCEDKMDAKSCCEDKMDLERSMNAVYLFELHRIKIREIWRLPTVVPERAVTKSPSVSFLVSRRKTHQHTISTLLLPFGPSISPHTLDQNIALADFPCLTQRDPLVGTAW